MRILQPRPRKERPRNKSDKIPRFRHETANRHRGTTTTAEFPNQAAFTVSAEILAQSLARLNSRQPVAFEKNIIYPNSRAFILLKKPSQKKRSGCENRRQLCVRLRVDDGCLR